MKNVPKNICMKENAFAVFKGIYIHAKNYANYA